LIKTNGIVTAIVGRRNDDIIYIELNLSVCKMFVRLLVCLCVCLTDRESPWNRSRFNVKATKISGKKNLIANLDNLTSGTTM
jgi:hypothetical protein